MGFPTQTYWHGVSFPSPGDLPHPGFKPTFLALAGAETPGKPYRSIKYLIWYSWSFPFSFCLISFYYLSVSSSHIDPLLCLSNIRDIPTWPCPWLPGSILPLLNYSFSLLMCVHAKSLQSCLTLCDPVDCNPPGSSVFGILQARILEWDAMPSSKACS